MTPAYCGVDSLNVLEWEEKGQRLEVCSQTVITPRVCPETISKAYFLVGQTSPSITVSTLVGSSANKEDADDLLALRESLGSPGKDVAFDKVRKAFDL